MSQILHIQIQYPVYNPGIIEKDKLIIFHFPDPEHGGWFKYLHRDGSVSLTLKGNSWGGPFHLPRMQLYCWKLLEEMLGGEG